MTLEMGESLMYSWLRHVKGCQIVQTNWTASPTWDMRYFMEAQDLYSRFLKDVSTENLVEDECKISFKQSLSQTEIDVIGLNKTSLSHNGKIYAAEVAFHSDGLHYNKNGKNNSTGKVISKLIKNAIAVYAIWGNIEAEILFVTPVISNTLNQSIQSAITTLNGLASSYGLNYNFRFIAGEDFKLRIIDPVYIMSQGVNDSSEMFLRAQKLLDISGVLSVKNNLKNPDSFDEFGAVGEIANKALRAVLSNKDINKKIITGLQPLISSSVLTPLVDTIPQGLSNRYYKTPIMAKNGEFYLCNNWFENKTTDLIDYIISLL